MEGLNLLVSALDGKHVSDIVVMDMAGYSADYDYMIVTTARNERIISGVLRELKDLDGQADLSLKFIEGANSGEWVVADFGGYVVHVFSEEMRVKYNLEKLWASVSRVDVSELLADEV